MYLDKLREYGFNIKDLLCDYLSERLNQPASDINCKIMHEKNYYDDQYEFWIKDVDKNNRPLTTVHSVTDFTYIRIGDNNYVASTFNGMDFAWINIVYSALCEISRDIADEYIEDARVHLEKSCRSYKDETEEVAKNAYDNAVREASRQRSEMLSQMLNGISDARAGFNELRKSIELGD